MCRGNFARTCLPVHRDLWKQTKTDHGFSRAKVFAGLLDIDSADIRIVGLNIGPTLTDDETADVMTIAGSDSSDSVTTIEQRKPAAERFHPIRTHRAGIDDFHRVERKIRASQVLSSDAIEIRFGKRSKTAVSVGRVIEDDDFYFWITANVFHQLRPIGNLVIRRSGGKRNGEDIEMTLRSCDLIAIHERKMLREAKFAHGR